MTLRPSGVAALSNLFTPNLFFIGGMRCGSTTLNLLLSQHPEIFMSPVKEPMFWVAETMRLRNEDPTTRLSGRYIEADAYAGLFEDAGATTWIGESSHYLYAPRVARVLKQANPEAKILVCFRDPAERFFSEYLYYLRTNRFQGDLAEFISMNKVEWNHQSGIIDVPPGSRLPKGLQAQHIKPWLDVFGRENIHFIFFEELERDPLSVMEAIFGWLGVDHGFRPKLVHLERGGDSRWIGKIQAPNSIKRQIKKMLPRLLLARLRAQMQARTIERPTFDPEIRAILRNYYSEDIKELALMADKDLSSWLV